METYNEERMWQLEIEIKKQKLKIEIEELVLKQMTLHYESEKKKPADGD